MSRNWKSGVSKFMISGFILIIVFSFMFTTQQYSGSVAGDSVANVDGRDVKIKEYQGALEQQINFYTQIYGGKRLTAKQIKQFGIKQFVLDNLVQKKVLLNLADKIGITIGEKEVKQTIKDQEYFKTEGKFDVNRYRQLLRANAYTPGSYEKLMIEEGQAAKMNDLLRSFTYSDDFIKNHSRVNLDTIKAHTVKIDKDKLIELVAITNQKVDDFAKEEKNQAIIKAIYNQRSKLYKKYGEVKASHILVKTGNTKSENQAKAEIEAIRKTLTTKNFATIANQKTEDPSGKGKGGKLGWFKKGVMDKNFEKVAFGTAKGKISAPVKSQFGYHLIFVQDKKEEVITPLEKVKKEVVKFHLQKSDLEAQKAMNDKVEKEVIDLLKNNDMKNLTKLEKKYGLTIQKDIEINQLSVNAGNLKFNNEALITKFFEKGAKFVAVSESDASFIKVLYPFEKTSSENLEKKITDDFKNKKSQLDGQFSNVLRKQIVDYVKENSSIVTNPKLL
ncbi:SurA N-terminal domain-containing protein [Bacteriovoracaceae bacterium]|nr:SurA N-terminal domain-containing protein [Bacteriovoracaceae bacterium]